MDTSAATSTLLQILCEVVEARIMDQDDGRPVCPSISLGHPGHFGG
jgi:hypothetical protein